MIQIKDLDRFISENNRRQRANEEGVTPLIPALIPPEFFTSHQQEQIKDKGGPIFGGDVSPHEGDVLESDVVCDDNVGNV